MSFRKIFVGFTLILLLCGTGELVRAQPGREGGSSDKLELLSFSGVSGTQQHLYVLAGGRIMQFELDGMKLIKTVLLPEPPRPRQAAPPKDAPSDRSPKYEADMSLPFGIWAGNGFLYVMGGPTIYRYTIPDLVLKATVELPRPESTSIAK